MQGLGDHPLSLDKKSDLNLKNPIFKFF